MPRKYSDNTPNVLYALSSFNEAGADAPEIHNRYGIEFEQTAGFNEAGADAPEIQRPCHWACGLEFRPFLRVVQVFNLVWSLKIGL